MVASGLILDFSASANVEFWSYFCLLSYGMEALWINLTEGRGSHVRRWYDTGAFWLKGEPRGASFLQKIPEYH